jgi:hypothetical protein
MLDKVKEIFYQFGIWLQTKCLIFIPLHIDAVYIKCSETTPGGNESSGEWEIR